jgi:hypothetical protein
MSPGFTALNNDTVIGRLPEIPAAAVKVYLTLARRADRSGWCYPSIGTIQANSGLARQTVCDAIKDLAGLGLVAVSAGPGGRGSHGYTLPAMVTGSKTRPVTGPETGPPPVQKLDSTGPEIELPPVQKLDPNNTHRTKPKNNTQSSCRTLRFDAADLATANWMFGLIQKLDPGHKKPNLEAWASEIRLTRERDGRTDQEIRDVFGWANTDSFWRTNILSPSKLREKFTQLRLKKESESNGNRNRIYRDGQGVGPGQRHTPGGRVTHI